MNPLRDRNLTRRAFMAGAAALPSAARASASPPARRAVDPRFDVVGATLHWAGVPIRLKGVAVGDPLYIRKDRPTSDYAVIATGWRANVVRISLHPGHWRADPDLAMKSLARDIGAARAVGLFVILDWHVIGFPDAYVERPDPSWGLPQDAYDADLPLAMSFWTEMARSFGQDPGIIFEIWNEPVVDPKLWVSTGQHWPLMKTVWLRLVGAIRRHSDALVLASGGRWAHDLKGVAGDLIEDPRTAYAWHCYPKEARQDPGGWGSSLGGLSCVKPVVVTEWGFCSPCGGDLRGTPEDFGVPFTRDVLDRLGLHSTAWSWSTGATPAMLDPDWRTPNAFGRLVMAYLDAPSTAAACPRAAASDGLTVGWDLRRAPLP